jgi:hypothetical protein
MHQRNYLTKLLALSSITGVAFGASCAQQKPIGVTYSDLNNSTSTNLIGRKIHFVAKLEYQSDQIVQKSIPRDPIVIDGLFIAQAPSVSEVREFYYKMIFSNSDGKDVATFYPVTFNDYLEKGTYSLEATFVGYGKEGLPILENIQGYNTK